jgi:ATP-dependent DNA ligase
MLANLGPTRAGNGIALGCPGKPGRSAWVLDVPKIICRRLPLGERKSQLQRLLARTTHGQYNEHLQDDGRIVFENACKFGCEGIVAKRLDSPYRSGRSKTWVKVKNPNSPAALWIEDGTF